MLESESLSAFCAQNVVRDDVMVTLEMERHGLLFIEDLEAFTAYANPILCLVDLHEVLVEVQLFERVSRHVGWALGALDFRVDRDPLPVHVDVVFQGLQVRVPLLHAQGTHFITSILLFFPFVHFLPGLLGHIHLVHP